MGETIQSIRKSGGGTNEWTLVREITATGTWYDLPSSGFNELLFLPVVNGVIWASGILPKSYFDRLTSNDQTYMLPSGYGNATEFIYIDVNGSTSPKKIKVHGAYYGGSVAGTFSLYCYKR